MAKGVVVCRCGHRTEVEPTIEARCPHCGHRLFRECRCGELIPRSERVCPYCGRDSRLERRGRRPRIRLRKLFLYSLVGFIGGWLLGSTVIFLAQRSATGGGVAGGAGPSFLPFRLGWGVLLVLSDAYRFAVDTATEYPQVLFAGLVGLVASAYYVARAQQMSLRRLRRHLLRKLQRWNGRLRPQEPQETKSVSR